jgi:hypothetical protein
VERCYGFPFEPSATLHIFLQLQLSNVLTKALNPRDRRMLFRVNKLAEDEKRVYVSLGPISSDIIETEATGD